MPPQNVSHARGIFYLIKDIDYDATTSDLVDADDVTICNISLRRRMQQGGFTTGRGAAQVVMLGKALMKAITPEGSIESDEALPGDIYLFIAGQRRRRSRLYTLHAALVTSFPFTGAALLRWRLSITLGDASMISLLMKSYIASPR